MSKSIATLEDDNGYIWIFDGWRVYGLEAEIEMKRDGTAENNGYRAISLEDATEILIDGGYIEKEKEWTKWVTLL